MSTETFAFDEPAATRILAKVTSSGDFLKIPAQELRTKDYERERRRLASFDLHSITLAEYHRLSRIPRGLRCHLRPTLFSDKPDYCDKFQNILNKCPLDIILLTVDFLQTAISESEGKIASIEEQLSTLLPAADWSSLKAKTDKVIEEHRKFLQERKRSKFQRDSEDYSQNRVYRWNDSASSESFFIQTPDSKTQHPPRRRPIRRATRKHRSYDDKVPGKTSNTVINISSYTLNPAELTVLQRGLSFCPTPQWDKFKLSQDLQHFFRNLRLKTHFGLLQDPSHNRIPTSVGDPIPALSIVNLGLRNTSSFNPPHNYHATKAYIELIQKDIDRIFEQHQTGNLPTYNNISPVEKKQALNSLRNNKSITIKPADKGGAIVVQNTMDYISEIHRQLSDGTTYKQISSDPTSTIKTRINAILHKYQSLKVIDSKTTTFLTNQYPVTPVIYTLPKIHKSLTNPPGRPIVASTDSILAPISIYLEKILTPLTRTMRSFILDTGHFLQTLGQFSPTPTESILVTFDVYKQWRISYNNAISPMIPGSSALNSYL
ncbi:unnamed protein product [Ranitomeya imitator]|uniref:Uncharacterized protein n=1 Tax=Ranitomeya imitator TaxID=111125 RepID=A0ABN9MBH8_9NEOB|nr:unnamed protein product [Ranitomeya imitator]